MNIHGLTVCVNYADLFTHGAALWRAGLDRMVVVTTPMDRAAQELALAVGAEVFTTDAFTRNGAAFNKGLALQEAIDATGIFDPAPRGEAEWCLFFDSDCVPPADWRAQIEGGIPEPGILYGAPRYQSPEDQPPTLNLRAPIPQGWVIGFFSLFHAEDPAIAPPGAPMLETDWTHAGNYDTTFSRRWPIKDGKQRMLNVPLIHVGSQRQNWHGRGNLKAMQRMWEARNRRGGSLEQERVGHPQWHPIPATMKGPSDRRAGIWRGGVLQVKVTNACDLDCKNCSVGVGLARKLRRIFRMTPEQFREALRSLRGYPGVIGMFGGNPCIHPDFAELCMIFRQEVPDRDQRGLWSNNLMGHGRLCAEVFSPNHSNLNVHGSRAALEEIKRDWPAAYAARTVMMQNGLMSPSEHAPVWTAIGDLMPGAAHEGERWDLIGKCYVNQTWSAEVTLVDGQLRGYFCELAATQAELYSDASLGMELRPNWWNQPIGAFESQVRKYCMACGVPLNGRKIRADDAAAPEEYTASHRELMLTIKGRPLKEVTRLDEIQTAPGCGAPATKYLPAGVMAPGQ